MGSIPQYLPFAEAKAHLSRVVDQAEHRGVATVITRHGKPVAAMVPVEDLDRLRVYERSDKRSGLAALVGRIAPAEELVEAALVARETDRSELPRAIPKMDDE